MLWTIFRLVHTALRVANLILLVYCIMSFVMPDSQLYRKASYYMERVLAPIRWQLWKWFPGLRTLPVDFSPLVLWVMLDIVGGLLNVLVRVIF